uniref:Uncharacterized protein n=1 Tax=Picea sitchensis TaxID=3332 RepID=A9NWA7_PICSI|nr:unknown [Picea sitchensis]
MDCLKNLQKQGLRNCRKRGYLRKGQFLSFNQIHYHLNQYCLLPKLITSWRLLSKVLEFFLQRMQLV